MGEEPFPLIYGTEFQARSLAVEHSENEVSRFMVGTQNINIANNQIHVVDVSDDGLLNNQTYKHSSGEIWHLHWSPQDLSLFSSTWASVADDGSVLNKATIWRLPSQGDQLQELVHFGSLDTVKMSSFHPIEKEKFLTICENKFVIWDLGDGGAKEVLSRTTDQKGHSKTNGGKWNPQESGCPLSTYQDTTIRGWDLRTSAPVWSIDQAHSYQVRDIDYNRNRCQTLASCGDDCCINIWDTRSLPSSVSSGPGAGGALLSLTGHSHWVWSVRYNPLHDELLLSSSSDTKVTLWWAGSVSCEPSTRYQDGRLVDYPDQEESVYRVEWSPADPWLFAALSYDGRLLIDKVPREHKYSILTEE